MAADPFFHMIIEDVFSIRGRGTVVTGKVDTGTLKVGDEVVIRGAKGDKKTVVTGIEAFRKMLEQANLGDAVGILLRDIAREDIGKGDELVSPGPDFSWKP